MDRNNTNQYDLAQTAMQLVAQRSTELDKIYDTVTEINLWCRAMTDRQVALQKAIKDQNDLISIAFDRIHSQQEKIISAGKVIGEELEKLHKLFHDIATLP